MVVRGKSSASIRYIGSISRYRYVRPQYIAAGTICRIFVRIGTFETAADGKIRAYPARRANRSKGLYDVRLTPCPLSTFVGYHPSRKSSRRRTRLANAYTQLRRRDPRRWQCRHGGHRADPRSRTQGRDDRAGFAGRDLPQPRLHAEESAGRGCTCARRYRARLGASHRRRKQTLDWAALIDPEKAIISGIPGSLADLMNRRGVEVIRERGRFAGPNAIAVGGETLDARQLSSPPVRSLGGCRFRAPN